MGGLWEDPMKWNSVRFGNVRKNIKQLEERLSTLQSKERTQEVVEEETLVSNSLDEWLAREELLWRQRARTKWLKAGDRNMAFFKAKSTQRRDRKQIK
ncbi:hypothetical protein QQ045_027024 [Rhodiola kirilowii]